VVSKIKQVAPVPKALKKLARERLESPKLPSQWMGVLMDDKMGLFLHGKCRKIEKRRAL
jgi:hypothetical protein